MGRKKSTPTRATDIESNETEYLGTLGHLSTANPNNNNDDNRVPYNENYPTSRAEETRKPSHRVRFAIEGGNQNESGVNEQKQQQEQQPQQARRRLRRKPRNEPSVTAKSNTRNVSFAKDLVTTYDARELPEVEIIMENFHNYTAPATAFDGKEVATSTPTQEISKKSIICYNYMYDPQSSESQENDVSGNNTLPKIALAKFPLKMCCGIEVTVPGSCKQNQQRQSETPKPPFPVTTQEGATLLLQLCQRPDDQSDKADDSLRQIESIASAVELGYLALTIEDFHPTNYRGAVVDPVEQWLQEQQQEQRNVSSFGVVVSLTNQAFESCKPSYPPVVTGNPSNLYREVLTLQRALADLLPKYAGFFPLSHPKSDEAITAKEVYSLVDNVQLKAFLNKKQPPQNRSSAHSDSNSGRLVIPGLLPTLRPYQEAAVRWMLEREKANNTHINTSSSAGPSNDEEWQLAWVVVLAGAFQGENKVNTPQQRVIFLPEYTKHYPYTIVQQKDPDRFFFSPFAGWLASSLEEARAMTLSNYNDASQKNGMGHPCVARGGILAESMGLGKTVEVLACILANPDPEGHLLSQNEKAVNVVSSSSSSSASALDSLDEDSSVLSAVVTENGIYAQEDVDGDASRKRRRQSTRLIEQELAAKRVRVRVRVVLPSDPVDRNSRGIENVVAVDDEFDLNAPSNLDDQWIDDRECEIGACICGQSISLFPSPPKESIVICVKCREPMHWECAAFRVERQQLPLLNRGIRYRKVFSQETFWARLCPESFCPCCVAENRCNQNENVNSISGKIRSRATVIVTPPAILSQWEREIKHHTRNAEKGNVAQPGLKVIVYPGVKNLCSDQVNVSGKRKDSFCMLHPRWLADADIVLMTFDTLRQDLGHSDSNPFAAGTGNTSLRKRKRFRVVPSPLSSILWWRVCLDECQRVETPTAASAKMALKLNTHYRWAVSGTPIGRGKLEDLFGLLLFLRTTSPFQEKEWFRRCFSSYAKDCYLGERIIRLLHRVFWRSTKSLDSVRIQMGVPPQTEKINILKFSSIEKHFYNRQLEKTLEIAGDISKKDGLRRNSRNYGKKNLDLLASQLQKLRAACCHPQVGSSGMSVGRSSRSGDSFYGNIRVLSMEKVLDRLIDDAKNQCEEALRVVLFHSNPMAAISRLKVEARNIHNIDMITESDEFLYAQSCKLYQDALTLADENASPSPLTGEAWMSGTRGFRSSLKQVRGGRAILVWQIQNQSAVGENDLDVADDEPTLWANFEFEGPPKKLCQIRLRTIPVLPDDLCGEGTQSLSWNIRYPRDCILQVSSSSAGGEFVDILSFSVPKPDGSSENWVTHAGFWIYRSKNWRVVIKSFHNDGWTPSRQHIDSTTHAGGFYVGLEVELYEPNIASDSLQRLHTLHNAIMAFRNFQAARSASETEKKEPRQCLAGFPLSKSASEIEDQIQSMQASLEKIERYHLEYAKSVHTDCNKRLEIASTARRNLEKDLFALSSDKKKNKHDGFWDLAWWDDAIAIVELRGSPSEKQSLCEKLLEAIDDCETFTSDKSKAFPTFYDLRGFQMALKLRLEDSFSKLRSGRFDKCIQASQGLLPNPNPGEVLENQTCHVCKAAWGQQGKKCRHCFVGDDLKVIDVEQYKMERAIFEAISKWSKANRTGIRNSRELKRINAVATKFFDVLEAARKEVLAASRLWRVHLDLLNVIDELNSCKTTMRLVQEGEDLSELTEEQKGSLIIPVDICARYHEHAAKQAMALANLRRQKHTLQYLKNQSTQQSEAGEQTEEEEETCMVCLSSFHSDRAVLACGHSLHMTPCLERLKKRSGNSTYISCPLRCTSRTKADDVLIASTQRNDDGSQSRRKVKGSWGTKVTAIVSDLLAVTDLGEKSIVFSMWETMHDIMQEALHTNGIKFVRASSLAHIAEATRSFRSSDCNVLLLNVKNGAEGLNLIEATHVFMIEPLLNCGLDSQATARCHRIGQTRPTCLHRYLIEDTIEIKIDKFRKQHQEDQLEDAIKEGRKCAIQAGGIDGGFASKEELMEMLSL